MTGAVYDFACTDSIAITTLFLVHIINYHHFDYIHCVMLVVPKWNRGVKGGESTIARLSLQVAQGVRPGAV
jgi:hypothetical protein